jgi:hypothetical protein
MYDKGPETSEQIAARFGKSTEWADLHAGDHKCIDGRRYVVSCLVSDPDCDDVARGRMAFNERERSNFQNASAASLTALVLS